MFELAVLEGIASAHPEIRANIQGLHVLTREFTGVGSFTNFECGAGQHLPQIPLSLKQHISMPQVPNGLGAVLFCRGPFPSCLEVFAFGDDHWDGKYEGYTIDPGV